MLLAVNITNKNIFFGIFDNDKLLNSYKIKSDINSSEDEIYILMKLLLEEDFSKSSIKDVIISSVVPELGLTMKNTLKKYLNIDAHMVGVGLRTGLNIKCENPKEVGSDRIVNSVAAVNLYGGPAIVTNLDHIMTFDFITDRKEFKGGLIFPGINLAKNALVNFSAKLPQVDIEYTKDAVGNTTVKAIQSGLINSYLSIFDGNLDKIISETGFDKDEINIIATGSQAELITKKTNHKIIIDKNLNLKGLNIIYKINKNK